MKLNLNLPELEAAETALLAYLANEANHSSLNVTAFKAKYCYTLNALAVVSKARGSNIKPQLEDVYDCLTFETLYV